MNGSWRSSGESATKSQDTIAPKQVGVGCFRGMTSYLGLCQRGFVGQLHVDVLLRMCDRIINGSVKVRSRRVVMSSQPKKHFFSVDEYYLMAQAGVFANQDRLELIDGEVVEMSPIGSTHQGCVDALCALLSEQLGKTAIVRVQGPIHIDEYSQPQPDIVLLKPRRDFYRRSHPTPGDILLVIEVADTSVEYDREIKLPLYARAGIQEAWLVLLSKDVVEVHSSPRIGRYQKVQRLKRAKKVQSQMMPGLALSVDSILG